MANVMSRALVALLALVVGACSGSPTAPDPVQPGPPVVVNPPTVQETVVEAGRPFQLSPCMSVCYVGVGYNLPALPKGKLRVSITLVEPQAKLLVILWSDSSAARREIGRREITTAHDPSDTALGNGSKGSAEFEEYDGEARYLSLINATPLSLHGGTQITHVREL